MSQVIKSYNSKPSYKKKPKTSSKRGYVSNVSLSSFKIKSKYYSNNYNYKKNHYSFKEVEVELGKETETEINEISNPSKDISFDEESSKEYIYRKNYQTKKFFKYEKKYSLNKTESSNSCKSTKSSITVNDESICSKSKEEINLSQEENLNLAQKKKIQNKFDIAEKTIKKEAFRKLVNPSSIIIQENTVVLSINVKISPTRIVSFKLKKYDDLFLTVKLFCEINKIREELIKPIIIKSLEAMNKVYIVMNSKIAQNDIDQLLRIKNKFNCSHI